MGFSVRVGRTVSWEGVLHSDTGDTRRWLEAASNVERTRSMLPATPLSASRGSPELESRKLSLQLQKMWVNGAPRTACDGPERKEDMGMPGGRSIGIVASHRQRVEHSLGNDGVKSSPIGTIYASSLLSSSLTSLVLTTYTLSSPIFYVSTRNIPLEGFGIDSHIFFCLKPRTTAAFFSRMQEKGSA
jgi:hypothetical protein